MSGSNQPAMDAQRAAIAHEFDAKAGVYEHNRLASWYQAHSDHIIAHLPLKPGDQVLDIGCATGYLLRRIVEIEPQARGIGVDLSPKMIEQARQNAQNLSQLTFIQADWAAPSPALEAALSDQPIHHAIMASMLHYLTQDELERDLKRVFDVLAPGGQIWLLERDPKGSPLTTLWDWAHRFVVRDQVQFFTPDHLITVLNQVGFVDVQVASKLRHLFWKGKLYTSLALLSGRKAPTHEPVLSQQSDQQQSDNARS